MEYINWLNRIYMYMNLVRRYKTLFHYDPQDFGCWFCGDIFQECKYKYHPYNFDGECYLMAFINDFDNM